MNPPPTLEHVGVNLTALCLCNNVTVLCICVTQQTSSDHSRDAGAAEERVMSRTHQIIQRTSESSLSIAADRLMDTDPDGEALTAQRQTVRRFVQETFQTT